ncbi:MAG: alpha/beta fold hydrolase [Deltaproteobacteria bacterium]|nr:alpha/beta fold hydrolase [Deltaproteobacteria bacterium]
MGGELRVVWSIAFLYLLTACGDDDGPGNTPDARPPVDSGGSPDASDGATPRDAGRDAIADAGPEPGDAGGPPPLDVVWEPCFGGGRDAECADIAVPLDWDDPSSATLTLFVKRFVVPDSTGQIWLLHGGPGLNARGFENALDLIMAVAPGLDVYLVDHRGGGASTPLSCPQLEDVTDLSALTEADFAGCVEHLLETQPDLLRATTPTAAGHDLAALIATVREPGDRVVVYGSSYGTYWAHRYLQLYPDQPDAVVLDGACDPATCGDWLLYEQEHDRLGRAELAACAADTDCAAHLTPTPEAFVSALRDGATFVCPEAFPAVPSPVRLAGLLMERTIGRRYLGPFFYRYARCTEADRTAIVNLQRSAFPLSTMTFGPGWAVSFAQVSFAMHPPATVEDALAFEATASFSKGNGLWMARAGTVWPLPEPDPLNATYADTDVPILILNGEDDPQTTAEQARAFAQGLERSNHYYVELPHTLHGAVRSSETAASLRGEEPPCGAQVMASFLASPETAPDTSCMADIVAPRIAGTPEENMAILGVPDAWD